MPEQVRSVSRYLGAMAVLLGMILAIAPPAIWFAFARGSLRAHLRQEAESCARMVTEQVAGNPLFWQYDEVRLNYALEGRQPFRGAGRRAVYDAREKVAEVRNGTLSPPVVSESAIVWDAGKPAGRVEASRSLRPLLGDAAWIGVLSASASAGILFLFLLYPVAAIRKALDSLAEQKESFRETFQSIADGVISTGEDGKVLLMNRAAESVTGRSLEEAVGRELREILPLQNDAGEPLSPWALPPGKPAVLASPSGARRTVDVSRVSILSRGTTSVRAVVVVRDVTDRKRMEEEIVRGQRLESLGLLAGGIAHDFNNLLTGVLGNISLAKEMVSPGQREYRRLEEAEKAAVKAKELSGRLLSFSRGWKPDRREVPVDEVIRDAARLAVRGTNVRCEFSLEEGLWGAFVDEGQIGQVINNLAVNAVHAMPGGGILRVDAENVAIGKGEVPHVKPGKYVKVTVSDEGTGIPPEILPRIFEPYFTTKENGSGLGLATCYTIMKGHGGNIFAESTPGRGATLRLFIPSTGSVLRAPDPLKKQGSLSGEGKVLLMDDEETIREVAGEMLAHLGYEPSLARDGGEAVEMYAKGMKGAGRFDLVILDLTVPGGMGGREAAARILEHDPDARIVISSGHAGEPAMSDPGKHGFAGAVAKPYRVEDLGRVLRDARLRRGPASGRP
jgi:PAS domain S-box-containing protein